MTSTLTSVPVLTGAKILGEPQLHTDSDLAALAFAADGSLWSIEESGILRHWNAQTGQQLDWQSLSDLETLWCFSNDARFLASASDDLSLWDASSGSILTALAQESWVTAAAFPPDTTCLATGHDDGTIRFWDLSAHQALQIWRHHHKAISAVAFRPDGKVVAAAAEDKTISLWDAQAGKLLGVLQGHTDRISSLAWHPDGKHLVSAGWDTTARVWDVNTQQPVLLLNTHAMQVTAVAFAADGSLLASADSKPSLHIWDFQAKKELHVLSDLQTEVRSLLFNRDSSLLAFNGERQIHLVAPRTGERRTAQGSSAGAKTAIAVSPDGGRVATNGGGLSPRIWNTAAATVERSLENRQRIVHGLAYTPDGKRVAGAAGQSIFVWNAATGKIEAELDGPEEPLSTLAISSDGSTLAGASSSGLTVWLWRLADGEPVLLIPDALDGCTIETLAFHPDGKRLAVGGIDWLATGGSNGAVAIWDIPGRYEQAAHFEGTTALAFHPGGKHLALATLEHSIELWDFVAQRVVHEFLGHDGPITAVAYASDGRTLVSASEDRTLRLWNEQGDEIAAWELDSVPTALAFSPDGKLLFTGNANTTCASINFPNLLPKKS